MKEIKIEGKERGGREDGRKGKLGKEEVSVK